MTSSPKPILITSDPPSAYPFARPDRSGGGAYDTVVVWDMPPGTDQAALAPVRLVDVSACSERTALRSKSLDEASEVAARLVASDWWRVYGINIAWTLRDFIVREVANHLLAILRIEAVFDELQPDAVDVPQPLKPGYYVADEMLCESVRLVAERRGIGFRTVSGTSRRARAALLGLRWRTGLALTQNRHLRQASLRPPAQRPPGNAAPADCRGTICIGPCWGAELQSHRPIGDALRERGWRLVFFETPSYYSRPDWRADSLPEGVTPVGDWGGNRAFVRAVRASEELVHRVGDTAALDRHQSVFRALGVDLLCSAYLRRRLTRLAANDARLAMAMHVCGQRMCEAVKPDLLLCVKAEGPELRGVMGAAQAAGIPVVFLPHGVNADDPRWADIPADLALCYGDQFAEIIAHRSGGKTATKVIGTPKCDSLFQEAEAADLSEARAAFGLPPRALWIGVATTNHPDQDLENTRAARQFAGAQGDAGVLVKTHPRLSQPGLVQRFQEAAGPDSVVLSKVDTMRALWCCDVVITGVSSAAIEAMAVGRPVIYVGDPADDVHGYATAGAVITVPAPSGVGEALSQMLRDRAAVESLVARGKQFAAHRLGPLDGRATERAVEEIERLAAGGKA